MQIHVVYAGILKLEMRYVRRYNEQNPKTSSFMNIICFIFHVQTQTML